MKNESILGLATAIRQTECPHPANFIPSSGCATFSRLLPSDGRGSSPHPAFGHLLPSDGRGMLSCPVCGGSTLLTQQQAAENLQVDVRSLIRFQNDGTVPFIQLGKLVRFFWPGVLAHLNAHFTIINRQGAKDAKAK